MSTTWFGFYYILGIFHVEDIRRFQGKLISPFQFIIELEDDVRLLSCVFVHLDSCLVGCIWSCQQLFARIPICIPEWDVLYARFTAFLAGRVCC